MYFLEKVNTALQNLKNHKVLIKDPVRPNEGPRLVMDPVGAALVRYTGGGLGFTQILFGQRHFFLPKNFWITIFFFILVLGPDFLVPKFVGPKFFSYPNFCLPNFFYT